MAKKTDQTVASVDQTAIDVVHASYESGGITIDEANAKLADLNADLIEATVSEEANASSGLSAEQTSILASSSGLPYMPLGAVMEPLEPANPIEAAMQRQEETDKIEAPIENTPKNTADMSETQMRAEDIISIYVPRASLIESAADARETLKIAATTQNELDGTIQARLARDLADSGYALIKEVPRKLSPGKDMPKALLKALQEHNTLLGTVETEKDTSNLVTTYRSTRENEKGDDTGFVEQSSGNVIDIISPYGGDRKTQSNVMPAAIKACLILIGHESRVQYGYIRKSEASGKRFTRNMVFLRRDQINEMEIENYLEAVCVPTNVVAPHKYLISTDEGISTLVPHRTNTNETLRYLVDDWAYALSQHHFNGVKLEYDLGPTKGKHPTGMLLRAPRAERPPQTGKGEEFAPSNYAEFAKGNDKQKEEYYKKQQELMKETRVAAMGAPGTENFATFLASLDTLATDKSQTLPENAVVNAVKLCNHILKRFVNERYESKTMLPTPLIREFVPLILQVNRNIKWNDDKGLWLWVNTLGEETPLTYRNGNGDTAKAA